jgi:hypothetical protein
MQFNVMQSHTNPQPAMGAYRMADLCGDTFGASEQVPCGDLIPDLKCLAALQILAIAQAIDCGLRLAIHPNSGRGHSPGLAQRLQRTRSESGSLTCGGCRALVEAYP